MVQPYLNLSIWPDHLLIQLNVHQNLGDVDSQRTHLKHRYTYVVL